MFKRASAADELRQSMQANLLEHKYAFDKLAQVIDHLSQAAQALQQAGAESDAEQVLNIIQELSR